MASSSYVGFANPKKTIAVLRRFWIRKSKKTEHTTVGSATPTIDARIFLHNTTLRRKQMPPPLWGPTLWKPQIHGFANPWRSWTFPDRHQNNVLKHRNFFTQNFLTHTISSIHWLADQPASTLVFDPVFFHSWSRPQLLLGTRPRDDRVKRIRVWKLGPSCTGHSIGHPAIHYISEYRLGSTPSGKSWSRNLEVKRFPLNRFHLLHNIQIRNAFIAFRVAISAMMPWP